MLNIDERATSLEERIYEANEEVEVIVIFFTM